MNIFLIIFAAVFVIVFIILILSSSQALQRFAVLEALLIAFVSVFTYFSSTFYGNNVRESTLVATESYLRPVSTMLLEAEYQFDFESGEDIDENIMLSNVANYIQAMPESVDAIDVESIIDSGIYSLTDDRIIYSVHYSKMPEDMYQQIRDEVYRAKDDVFNSSVSKEIEGKLYFANCSSSDNSPKYVAYAVITTESLETAIRLIVEKVIISALILLAVMTLILGVVLFIQSRELKGLIKRIKRAASGVESWEVLKTRVPGFYVESDDIRTLRMSLNQLVNEEDRYSHRVIEKLKSYHRFTPHNIERIYGGKNILAIDEGDVIDITGVIASVSLSLPRSRGEAYQKKVAERFKEIIAARDVHNGMTIAVNHDISDVTCFFDGKSEEAFEFGMDVVRDSDSFVMLHKTTVTCGIVGCDKELVQYTPSREINILEKYSEKLRAMGLTMVITDRVKEFIPNSVSTRYIGFIENEGFKYKLYEVLDAYGSSIMQARTATAGKFAEAINLFYQDDFYLARNMFSEILKTDANDPITTWYLFVCENNLNSIKNSNSYALFAGEI